MANQIMYIKAAILLSQAAIDMDWDGPDNLLQGEEAYFDGSHSLCVGYKTLTLFVYHPAKWYILRLATMEVKVNQHVKAVCCGNCLIRSLARLQ